MLDKKELEKDVKFYRSKIKVLLNDMLEYGKNELKEIKEDTHNV